MHDRMRRRWHKITFVLVAACTLFTCIDPYTPELKSFESRLVVDALITDEDKSNYVILTRTVETGDEDPVRVTGATVIISDDAGNSTILVERHAGEYRTDSLTFRGATGRTYKLSIESESGEKYESAPSFMHPVPDIDSIYFSKDQLLSEETGEMVQGVSIFIDSRDESAGNYYRWSYEEWWKFQAPDEIASLDLPLYVYDCERIEKGEVDYPSTTPGERYTFDEINEGFLNSGFTFIKPVYRDNGELYRLVFVRPFCAECTVNGTMNKPSFWVDIE